jgi:hypothetical protein
MQVRWPVTTPPDRNSPSAEAMEWVSRIAAVALMMVLPGLGGQWLDGRLGTKFVALLGFALGVTSGIAYLVMITKPQHRDSRSTNADGQKASKTPGTKTTGRSEKDNDGE